MKQRLKTNGVIIVLALTCIAFFPRAFLRNVHPTFLSEAAKVIGLSGILLGQLFRASARGFKAQYSLQGRLLLKEGPYALIRNPMYLGIIIIGCGVVLMLFRLWVLGAFIIVYITRYILLTFQEEKKLLGIFAEQYSTYTKTVPRLLPSFKKLLTGEISEYLPLRVAWIKKESATIASLLGPLFLYSSYISVRWIGVEFFVMQAIAYALTLGAFTLLAIYLIAHTKET